MTKNQWQMLTLDLYLPLTSFGLLMGGGTILVLTPFSRQ